jgi:hypothetical protein
MSTCNTAMRQIEPSLSYVAPKSLHLTWLRRDSFAAANPAFALCLPPAAVRLRPTPARATLATQIQRQDGLNPPKAFPLALVFRSEAVVAKSPCSCGVTLTHRMKTSNSLWRIVPQEILSRRCVACRRLKSREGLLSTAFGVNFATCRYSYDFQTKRPSNWLWGNLFRGFPGKVGPRGKPLCRRRH